MHKLHHEESVENAASFIGWSVILLAASSGLSEPFLEEEIAHAHSIIYFWCSGTYGDGIRDKDKDHAVPEWSIRQLT